MPVTDINIGAKRSNLLIPILSIPVTNGANKPEQNGASFSAVEFVLVVNRKAPRALRSALHMAVGVRRVGGACWPTGSNLALC
jgi:hypothetical protein